MTGALHFTIHPSGLPTVREVDEEKTLDSPAPAQYHAIPHPPPTPQHSPAYTLLSPPASPGVTMSSPTYNLHRGYDSDPGYSQAKAVVEAYTDAPKQTASAPLLSESEKEPVAAPVEKPLANWWRECLRGKKLLTAMSVLLFISSAVILVIGELQVPVPASCARKLTISPP